MNTFLENHLLFEQRVKKIKDEIKKTINNISIYEYNILSEQK